MNAQSSGLAHALMFGSLRNQILVPLVAIQTLAVTATALTTASLAARRSERQIIDRLNGVINALGDANFPYTTGILKRMSDLSGAQFVASDDAGRTTASSLSDFRAGQRTPMRPIAASRHLVSLGDSPHVQIDGRRYFAVRLRTPETPRNSSLLVLYPEASWRQARWEAGMPPIALGLVSLGGMAVVSTWIANRITARIRRLERQVARIAEGDFRELDPAPGQDELHELSRSVNRMCRQLNELRGTVEQTERTRLLAQLAAGLAHQLRNSLTGARMSVQLHARRHPSSDGDQSLEVALRQLSMTEEQVRGLLSLGRLERRAPEPCDLSRMLGDVALLVGPSARHAGVEVIVDPSEGSVQILADPSGLRAALLNLTLNAIEAAGAGGRVRLSLVSDDRQVRVLVADTGPGPPSELADTLLEPFVTGKPEGVGLGLALAHQVASEHQGRLSWEREDDRTIFSLTFPKLGFEILS